MFGNWLSCACATKLVDLHAYIWRNLEIFLNKDFFLLINAQKGSSLKALKPNIFFSTFGPIISIIATTYALVVGFILSKHTCHQKNRGTTQQPDPSSSACFWQSEHQVFTHQENNTATSLIHIHTKYSSLEHNKLARTSADTTPIQNFQDKNA